MAGKPKTKPQEALEAEQVYVGIVRAHVPNSHITPWIVEKVTIVGDKVIKKERVYGPDMLELVMENAKLLLDPEF